MTNFGKYLFAALPALLFLPMSAQERADTAYTFRFMPDRDMFYIPYHGNDAELARLEKCIGNHKTDIIDGKFMSTDIATPLTARPGTSPWRGLAPTA